jgi:ATP-binding cassette, subfamily B, bacterial
MSDRAGRWLGLIRLLPRAGPGLLAAAVALNLALGLLPLLFVVGMSALLAGLPAGRAGPIGLALTVAIGALVLQQVLGSFQPALADAVARRVDAHCVRRLMTASLRSAPVAALERADVRDALADCRAAFAREMSTPGDAAAATLALLARYTQLTGAAVLLAAVRHPVAGAAMAATALAVRSGQRGSLGRFATMWAGLAPARRRAHYLRGVATGTSAAKEIRVLGLRTWLTDRLTTDTRAYLTALWTGRRAVGLWPFVALAGVAALGGGLVLADLARATAAGSLSILRFAVALQAILIPMRFATYFPECDVQTQFGAQAYRTLLDFEALAAAPAATSGAEPGPPRHAIRFENVSFAYPGGPPVFDGLDLELPAGRSTAVVGLNGAGKTTLVKLLARCHDPTAGRITVDGRDLRDLDATAWRRQLAVVFQDFIRYELSARENIALGAPQLLSDDAAIHAAAQRGGAAPLLATLPSGLATPLFSRYDGGRDLSGGQWQRIALSRAFLATARGSILVLDEPTAQLDVRAEVEFYDRFLARTRGLTSVVISHRFSTVRRADTIVVLDRGKVVEQGTHDALLAADGRYASMFRLQASRFADDATPGPARRVRPPDGDPPAKGRRPTTVDGVP